MMPNVGMGELLVILLVILLLFGAKRLPDVARGLGRSIKAFKDGMREGLEDQNSNSSETKPDPKSPPPQS